MLGWWRKLFGSKPAVDLTFGDPAFAERILARHGVQVEAYLGAARLVYRLPRPKSAPVSATEPLRELVHNLRTQVERLQHKETQWLTTQRTTLSRLEKTYREQIRVEVRQLADATPLLRRVQQETRAGQERTVRTLESKLMPSLVRQERVLERGERWSERMFHRWQTTAPLPAMLAQERVKQKAPDHPLAQRLLLWNRVEPKRSVSDPLQAKWLHWPLVSTDRILERAMWTVFRSERQVLEQVSRVEQMFRHSGSQALQSGQRTTPGLTSKTPQAAQAESTVSASLTLVKQYLNTAVTRSEKAVWERVRVWIERFERVVLPVFVTLPPQTLLHAARNESARQSRTTTGQEPAQTPDAASKATTQGHAQTPHTVSKAAEQAYAQALQLVHRRQKVPAPSDSQTREPSAARGAHGWQEAGVGAGWSQFEGQAAKYGRGGNGLGATRRFAGQGAPGLDQSASVQELPPQIDMERLVDQVYRQLEKRLKFEQQRRGL